MYTKENAALRVDKESGSITNANSSYNSTRSMMFVNGNLNAYN